VFPEVAFESTRGMSQGEFATWVQARARNDPHSYELLNGRIVMNPPAGFPHGSIESRVVRLLANFVVEGDLGEVLGSSQGYALPSGDTLEPDASFVSQARWSAMPAPRPGEFLQVVPDLVVEILSISTASYDRGEKRSIYERNGVREYWLIDPRSRELVQLCLEDGQFVASEPIDEAGRTASRVLDGLEIAVAGLFPG
jgi:Uma2 family endonuclease